MRPFYLAICRISAVCASSYISAAVRWSPHLPSHVGDIIAQVVAEGEKPREESHRPLPSGEAKPEEETAIGVFRIGALVGRGVLSEVYRVEDHDLAVKYSVLSEMPHGLVVQYAVLKYIAGHAISVHPIYVSPPSSAGRKHARFLITTLAGLSLEAFVRSRPLQMLMLHEALAVGIRVTALLERLHATGLLHRDIHAGNVAFASPAGSPDLMTDDLVLLDFELAHVQDRTHRRVGDLKQMITMMVTMCPPVGHFMPPRHIPAGGVVFDSLTGPYGLTAEMSDALSSSLGRVYDAINEVGKAGRESPRPDYSAITSHLTEALQILVPA